MAVNRIYLELTIQGDVKLDQCLQLNTYELSSLVSYVKNALVRNLHKRLKRAGIMQDDLTQVERRYKCSQCNKV
ncbi:hypothetical protein DdX_05270 [Ditylenchus destructor]|uniref:Uncharacterized protein n=1 Tax=Ditylenchus destructor TaxID=166010 RepID=A0AAD4RAW7_9BILA|nr:hypothetical protein DdX_05270 [Ditylenchus destructor]